MNKLNKTHGLFILFILLILLLVFKPDIIKNMYNTFLGRLILVGIVIFFAMNNMTLGLLTAFVFIIFSLASFFLCNSALHFIDLLSHLNFKFIVLVF